MTSSLFTKSTITKWASLLVALFLLSACGGKKTIPMTVQSDPLGAYVTYQVRRKDDKRSDWVFLGKTPLDIKRAIPKKTLKKAEAFRMRVMKDGYNDQVRDWTGKDLGAEIDEKGRLFWNPRMVPSK